MKNGLKPIAKDKRDFAYHKTFGSVGIFPDNFSTDAALTMPDQDAVNTQFNPPVPALPYGCTDYAQSELCIDEDKTLYNPILLDNVTHANADSGCDIRVSLAAALSVYNRQAYFNVQPTTDWFDGIRSALYTADRSVSIGTPWMNEWRSTNAGIIPDIFVFTGTEPWHNWKICGWKVIDGITYLIGKTWQGVNYGDSGWAYFSRETINNVMAISGTGAFTVAPIQGATIQTIEVGLYEKCISLLQQLLGLLS